MTITTPRRRPRGLRALSLGLSAALTLGLVGLSATPVQAAVDPIAGALTSGDSLFPHVGNGGYDVEHYDIDLAWTPGAPVATTSTIVATTTIKATTTGAPLSSFGLDFEGLTVDSLTVNGVPATFTRDQVLAEQKHKLVVTPATPVDGAFTTVVKYSGVPATHRDPDGSREGWFGTSDGATALNEPVGAMTWFPNNNSLKDKATFDIKLDIPRLMDGESMAAASNGELVSKTRNGARETWHWRQKNQMATYLSMVSIGKYEVRESDITLSDGRVIRDWTFIDSAISATSRATTITTLGLTQDIIQFLESKFGPYPGNSSGAVVDVLSAGYALETQDRSFYPSSVGRGTLIHEIAHQWFGNAVSPTDWSDLWLNEGAGDYMPRLYNNARGFNNTATPEQTYFTSWNSSSPTAAQWQVPLAGFTDPAILFNYVYGRGGQTYEALRTTVGDDVWFETLRSWIAKHNGSDASTADFIAHASEVYGQDVKPVFDTWAYGVGKAPWPMRWKLDLASDATEDVAVGDTVKHTLTASNTGRVALSGKTATVDVADLLDDASIDVESLPEGLTLDGTTLTWTVPTIAGPASQAPITTPSPSASVSFDSVVRPTSSGGTIATTATANGIGAFYGARSTSVGTEVQADSWTLGLTSDPASGGVEPGDVITYTASVQNTATHDLQGAKAEIDVADLIGDAELGELPEGLTLEGTTLTWTVPTTAPEATSTVEFSATVGDVSNATLTVSAAASSEGGTETPSVTHTVGLKAIAPAPVPTVSGTTKVGTTLTADAGTWRAGTSLTYQWSVGGKPVAGATGATYALRPADAYKTVTVAVTGTLDGWAPGTRSSTPTARVAPATLTRSPRVFIAGLPKVGRTLKVDVGTWDKGVTHQYTWYRNGKKIGGANKKTYKVKKKDAGKRLQARVITKKPGYVTVTKKTPRTVRVLK